MSEELILILGGARSGKSAYAQRLALETGRQVVFVATAEPGDEEMAARIRRHKVERPVGWRTVETPTRVGEALGGQDLESCVVLIDCLTLLASNRLTEASDPVQLWEAEEAIQDEVDRLLEAYRGSKATWIVVSNEVGMGIVPPHPLGRVYRDALGRMNQEMARAADRVLLMVAGLPVLVKG